jgi:hypothetical protein
VALVRTDVSEEPGASFIRVTKIGELETTQAATSNRRTQRGSLYKIRFVQERRKLNDISGNDRSRFHCPHLNLVSRSIMVELYLHFHTRLNSVVLSKLSTGISLPLPSVTPPCTISTRLLRSDLPSVLHGQPIATSFAGI